MTCLIPQLLALTMTTAPGSAVLGFAPAAVLAQRGVSEGVGLDEEGDRGGSGRERPGRGERPGGDARPGGGGNGKPFELGETEYLADLKEAAEKAAKQKRPVLVFVDSDSDRNTYAELQRKALEEPRLAELIRKSFVPVRLEEKEDLDLLKPMRVSKAPALVVMGDADKVERRFTRYTKSEDVYKALIEQLEKMGYDVPVVNLAELREVLEQADGLYKQGEFAKALTDYRRVAAADSSAVEVRVAKRRVDEIERAAERELAIADEALVREQFVKADRVYRKVMEIYAGTAMAEAAAKKVETIDPKKIDRRDALMADATAMYAQAQKDYENKRYAEAQEAFRKIAQDFGELPVGADAKWQVERMEKDDRVQTAIRDAAAEGEARKLMQRASNWSKNDYDKKAIEIYEQVIKTYPGTTFAKEAEQRVRYIKLGIDR